MAVSTRNPEIDKREVIEMLGRITQLGLAVSCLAAVLAVGCGGMQSSPLGDAEAVLDNGGSDSGQSQAYVSDGFLSLHEVSKLAEEEELLPYDPEEYPQPSDLLWLLRHQSVASGENELDHTLMLAHSSNAEVTTGIVGWTLDGGGHIVPEYGDVVRLESSAGEMSYVTYALKDIPDGEEIRKIEIDGIGEFGTHAGAGLWIGVGDMDSGAYNWYGPKTETSGGYELSLFNPSSANDAHRAYFTLAVYNGDEFQINEIRVTIGEPAEFTTPPFEMEFLFEVMPYEPLSP